MPPVRWISCRRSRARKAIPPAASKANKPAKRDLGPQTPEQKKQQLQLTIVAFNMASGLTAVVMSARVATLVFCATAFTAIPVGLIVAGITWSVLGSRR